MKWESIICPRCVNGLTIYKIFRGMIFVLVCGWAVIVGKNDQPEKKNKSEQEILSLPLSLARAARVCLLLRAAS